MRIAVSTMFLCLATLLPAVVSADLVDSLVIVNEFHYDDSESSDQEFLEIGFLQDGTTRLLRDIRVDLYDSSRSFYRIYDGSDMQIGGMAEINNKMYRLLCLDILNFNDGFGGIAVSYQSELMQFVSYGGPPMLARNGIAEGLRAQSVNVFEDSKTSPNASISYISSGNGGNWFNTSQNTKGQANIAPVPEPTTLPFLAIFGVLALQHRNRQSGLRSSQ